MLFNNYSYRKFSWLFIRLITNHFIILFYLFLFLLYFILTHFYYYILTILRYGMAFSVMALILDGCSFHYAHTCSKSGFPICWRHLVTSKESSNPIFFLRKKTLFSSFVRNVKWATIYSKNHAWDKQTKKKIVCQSICIIVC